MARPRWWATVALVAAVIAVVATVEPVRLAVHVVLNGLRDQPLTIEPPAASAAPDAPTPAVSDELPTDAIAIAVRRQPDVLADPSPAELAALPLRLLTIDPPFGFDAHPRLWATARGAWDINVDFEKLQPFLRGQDIRVPIPPSLRTATIQIRGGTVVASTWADASESGQPLTLVQIGAPQIDAPAGLDLEIVAEAVLAEVLPPIVARRIDLADVPVLRDALGLPAAPATASGLTAVPLPDGRRLVSFAAAESHVLLIAPLAADDLVSLAAQVRPR